MVPVWAALEDSRLSIIGTRRTRLSVQRGNGNTITRGDLEAMACRNAKTPLQLSVMEANVLAVAVLEEVHFALPGFFVWAATVLAEA